MQGEKKEERGKNLVRDRLIGTVVALLVFLVGFYFQSFAKGSALKLLEAKHNYDIRQIESKFDKILTGLCIINKRTCKLKE